MTQGIVSLKNCLWPLRSADGAGLKAAASGAYHIAIKLLGC